ncbi:hypothetical protein [Pseudidiomarina halophila]|uniref:hypothetical protein n=1 Tax=Pseudidiomarina halophila TaxID=1449799 RepID=UPI00360CDAD4
MRRTDDGTVEGLNFYQIGATEPEFSRKVSDEVAVRSVVELSEDQAARLIGDYQLQPNFVISVRYTDAGITAQATGQSAFLVKAESPTVLFNEQFGIVMEFQLPEQGSAEQLTLIQGGQKLPAPRIENNEEGE